MSHFEDFKREPLGFLADFGPVWKLFGLLVLAWLVGHYGLGLFSAVAPVECRCAELPP